MHNKYLVIMFAIFTALGVSSAAVAQDQPQENERRVIVEELPSLKEIKHVSASQTHSGYPVPRYVSLKFDHVNGRKGPSVKHPKAWEYRRKDLPLVVVAEMDIWRKVRDMHGDESWVRTYALSGKRHVITLDTIPLRKKPKEDGRVTATAPKDSLLHLMSCNDDTWCKVSSEAGYKGWARRAMLWGAEPF